MINYSKIKIQKKVNEVETTEGLFYGLSFMQSAWGNINLPTLVLDNKELVNKFGNYDTPNDEDTWMQLWNFLEYSQNLKIFRVAKQEPTESFTSVYLTSVTGSSHAFQLLNNRNEDYPYRTWTTTDKGSNIYFKLNDFKREKNLPTFNDTTQILDVYAKYAGSRGNNFKLTFFSYLDDLSQWKVFQEYQILTYTSPIGTYTVGNTLTGDDSGASGTIMKVLTSGSTTKVWVELLNVPFVAGEDDNLTNTIVSTDEATEVSENPKMSDMVDRNLNINEFVFVLTEDGEILESNILSLDINQDNFVEDYESDWLNFFKNENVEIAVSTDSDATKDLKVIGSWQELALTYGVSDSVSSCEIVTQLDILNDVYKADFDIIFSETDDNDILNKLIDINSKRSEILIILNEKN